MISTFYRVSWFERLHRFISKGASRKGICCGGFYKFMSSIKVWQTSGSVDTCLYPRLNERLWNVIFGWMLGELAEDFTITNKTVIVPAGIILIPLSKYCLQKIVISTENFKRMLLILLSFICKRKNNLHCI